MVSLSERATVDEIVSEWISNFKLFSNEAERREKVFKALCDIGPLEEESERYPHEFSGGQGKRICVHRRGQTDFRPGRIQPRLSVEPP